jgi:DNA-directed RNA polymerase subunit N (RpoN/RPB10)
MIPIRHAGCGGQIGFYLGEVARKGDPFSSDTFLRMGGKHPEYCSVPSETCPTCGKVIVSVSEMVRDVG